MIDVNVISEWRVAALKKWCDNLLFALETGATGGETRFVNGLDYVNAVAARATAIVAPKSQAPSEFLRAGLSWLDDASGDAAIGASAKRLADLIRRSLED